ncbi:transposase [Rhodobacteraceae bacterium CCMM004]|nr:transposase [Rhodobacteraceae bacterium CCMM004]
MGCVPGWRLGTFEGGAQDASVRWNDPPNGLLDGFLIAAPAGRDVRDLAEMGRMRRLDATAPPDPHRVRLADSVRRRWHLVEMRKAERVRRHTAGQPSIIEKTETMIAPVDRRVAEMDRQIADIIAVNRKLAELPRLLLGVPGAGPTVLSEHLGEMPELSALCGGPSASLPSLAPRARESET